MSIPSYSSSTTRFLTLNQPLPGEEKKRETRKPQRIYRAQKAPHWVVEGDEDGADEEPTFVDRMHGVGWEEEDEQPVTTAGAAYEETLRQAQEEVQVKVQDLVAEVIEEPEPNVEEFDLSKLQDLEVPEMAPVPSDNEEELRTARVRARVKAEAKQKQAQAFEHGEPPKEESANESESESTEESSYESDYDMPSRPRRMKPMFLAKRERKKLAGRDRAGDQKQAIEMYQKDLTHKRRQDARSKMIEIVRLQDQLREQNSSDEELPNTDDDDEDEQFEAWKLRELKRIKREKDALDAVEQEKVDLEKRRKMSNVEIERDNELHGVDKTRNQPKAKMKFMQKYYHKGAFYQDDTVVSDKIMKRNYMAPTKEDKWLNFENLPKVMQVKNWGMASRTKYTHLVDQDTTVHGAGDFNEVKSTRAEYSNVNAMPDYEEDIWRDVIRTRRQGGPRTSALDRIGKIRSRSDPGRPQSKIKRRAIGDRLG